MILGTMGEYQKLNQVFRSHAILFHQNCMGYLKGTETIVWFDSLIRRSRGNDVMVHVHLLMTKSTIFLLHTLLTLFILCILYFISIALYMLIILSISSPYFMLIFHIL